VEVENERALICKRCVKNLKHAVEFKKMCIESDLNFKKKSNEHFAWFQNLGLLKVSSMELPETTEISHQSPMISDERFQSFMADAADLIKETLQADEEKMVHNDQFSQIDPDERYDFPTDDLYPQQQQPDLSFIDNLTVEQLKEATLDISNLLKECSAHETPTNLGKSDLLILSTDRSSARTRLKRKVANVSQVRHSDVKVLRLNYKYK
jgi:hypothetical protein